MQKNNSKTDSDLAHDDEIILLNAKVFQLEQEGRFSEAQPVARQAAWLALSYSNETYCAGAIESLVNLAGIHFIFRKYDAADSLFESVLAIIGGENRKGELGIPASWHDYAKIIVESGATITDIRSDGSEGEKEVLPASETRMFGAKNSPLYSDYLSNYAAFYQMKNNYAVAEQLYLQIIESDRGLGRKREWAISLGHLATLYLEMGKYSAAEALLMDALALKLETVGDRHPSYAITLAQLALIYKSMHNTEKAERFARKALKIHQKSFDKNHPQVARSLCALGSHLLSLGNSEKLDEAEKCLKMAIDIQQGLSSDLAPDLAMSFNNLSQVYFRKGLYTDAEELLKKAAVIWQINYGEQHPTYTVAINSLAVLYEKKGDYVAAEKLMRQALEIRQTIQGRQHPSTAVILFNLAHLCVLTNRISDAFILLKQSISVHDILFEDVFPVLSEEERLNYLAAARTDLPFFLSLVLEYLPRNRDAAEAAMSLVLRRKGISAEALSVQRNAILNGRYPDLQPKLTEIENLRAQIGQRILWETQTSDVDVRQETIAALKRRKESLEKELARQLWEINLKQQTLLSDWRTIAHALPADSALVEFVYHTPVDFRINPAPTNEQEVSRYLAFILSSRNPEDLHVIDLGTAQKIEQLVEAFRFLIENSSSVNGEYELRRIIFDPLVDAFGDCTHIFLAPDGDLNRLPFETLPLDDDHYVIDKYEISYLSTGRDILRFGIAVDGDASQPLVVADPNFEFGAAADLGGEPNNPTGTFANLLAEISSGGCFKKLIGSRVEGEQIAQLLQVSPLLDNDALKSRIKSCRSPRILHIATHGFFLPEIKNDSETSLSNDNPVNPMQRSGLVFAGVNSWLKKIPLCKEAEDGILTAEDVMGMDLLNTELVVLSSCETGLGAIQTGEGVFGLRRSFVVAGAKSLVMSLWKVPDQQTQTLMLDFYNRILSGQACAQSLREAQLNLKKQFPLPKYWGGFICQGNPGPLSK